MRNQLRRCVYITAQYVANPTVMSGPATPNLSSNWNSNAGPQGYYISPMADYSAVNMHGGGGGYNSSITPTVQNGGIVERIGRALDAAGVIASSHFALYYNNAKYNASWVMGNLNGKNVWYGTNGANQYKMSIVKAAEDVKILKGLGFYVSFASVGVSIFETYNTLNNSDNHWERFNSVMDLESNIAGATLGPIGAAFNGGYIFGRYMGRILVKNIYDVIIR